MIGRGRLSSMDLVPEHARDDIVWALQELNKRARTQADILFELNDRLAVKGVDPISSSAFNRRAVRLAVAARRLEESRYLFAGLADQFTPDKIDQSNIGLGEVIKTLIFELTDPNEKQISTKGAMELARAYLATIQGQKISAERRLKLEADMKDRAVKAIDKVAQEKGLSGDVVQRLKREFLGVRALPVPNPAEGPAAAPTVPAGDGDAGA